MASFSKSAQDRVLRKTKRNEDVVARRLNGESLATIGKAHGLSKRRVLDICDEHGVSRDEIAVIASKYAERDKDIVARRRRGEHAIKVANLYNISRQRVRQICIANGYTGQTKESDKTQHA